MARSCGARSLTLRCSSRAQDSAVPGGSHTTPHSAFYVLRSTMLHTTTHLKCTVLRSPRAQDGGVPGGWLYLPGLDSWGHDVGDQVGRGGAGHSRRNSAREP